MSSSKTRIYKISGVNIPQRKYSYGIWHFIFVISGYTSINTKKENFNLWGSNLKCPSSLVKKPGPSIPPEIQDGGGVAVDFSFDSQKYK